METWRRISGGKPFVLKGIQHVADAKKAVAIGCDGIVISNHAGRQVDGAIASLDALENIVEGEFDWELFCGGFWLTLGFLLQLLGIKRTSCTIAESEAPPTLSRRSLWVPSLFSLADSGFGD